MKLVSTLILTAAFAFAASNAVAADVHHGKKVKHNTHHSQSHKAKKKHKASEEGRKFNKKEGNEHKTSFRGEDRGFEGGKNYNHPLWHKRMGNH
mgnify:CR=1 FL=1